MASGFFEHVYRLVERIPCGRVASYGQIAALLGQPRAARTVGWALQALPSEGDRAARVPWHRVVNAGGKITIPGPLGAAFQRHLLEEEGVQFDDRGCVRMARSRWSGLSAAEVAQALLDEANI